MKTIAVSCNSVPLLYHEYLKTTNSMYIGQIGPGITCLGGRVPNMLTKGVGTKSIDYDSHPLQLYLRKTISILKMIIYVGTSDT